MPQSPHPRSLLCISLQKHRQLRSRWGKGSSRRSSNTTNDDRPSLLFFKVVAMGAAMAMGAAIAVTATDVAVIVLRVSSLEVDLPLWQLLVGVVGLVQHNNVLQALARPLATLATMLRTRAARAPMR